VNNLDESTSTSSATGNFELVNTKAIPELVMREQAEAISQLYRRLQRQRLFRGFGCINKDTYPYKSSDMPPVKLEQVTGLSMNALTPRERPAYWRNAGTGKLICVVL
jgi:hypothetical protein